VNNQSETFQELRHVRELLARLASAARRLLEELEKPEIQKNPALSKLVHRAAELRIVTDNSGDSTSGRSSGEHPPGR
jgi:hypothetical protein